MANFTRAQVSIACSHYGSQLENVPQGLDGSRILWAIAGNESSFGENCAPRYEPAYGPGGRYFSPSTYEKFGKLGCSSLGVWQIMFVNCPSNYVPSDMDDLDKAAVATVLFLNRQLNRFRPSTLRSIGAIWNGGNPGALQRPEVQVYADRLERNYAVPLMEIA